MDVLILGWSDIVRRRVVPALAGLAEVDRIHLASESVVTAPDGLSGESFTGSSAVEDALDTLPEALVYVSGVNTSHADRISRALGTGHHVIVDKPAFLQHRDAQRCLAIAAAEGRLLAEATVWAWHAQVRGLVDRMTALGLEVRTLDSVFVIPALPDTNFRTDPARGGGVVADMGVYAMSAGRAVGGGDVAGLDASVTGRAQTGLDLALRVEATYSSGMSMTGRFSMDGPYENRLTVRGDDWDAALSPAFSSKPDAELRIALTVGGEDLSFTVEPCDPFSAFLHAALTEGVSSPGSWTAATSDSAGDLLRLAAAADVGWGDEHSVH